ncbi:hypothetical protein Fot_42056 [Forsythia ovata]|uniref:Cytochrome b-c1 complex subunit 7 n=1 Tax=Forsythia ovata TaxID=205694 RepID=A0ABD1RK34_9LAMI
MEGNPILVDILRLRYDDLYDPMYDLDVKEAMNRLPREIVDARNQRLKRALDLSMKHEYLPEELQKKSSQFVHCHLRHVFRFFDSGGCMHDQTSRKASKNFFNYPFILD